jgi:protein required for attachment to host cells
VHINEKEFNKQIDKIKNQYKDLPFTKDYDFDSLIEEKTIYREDQSKRDAKRDAKDEEARQLYESLMQEPDFAEAGKRAEASGQYDEDTLKAVVQMYIEKDWSDKDHTLNSMSQKDKLRKMEGWAKADVKDLLDRKVVTEEYAELWAAHKLFKTRDEIEKAYDDEQINKSQYKILLEML